MTARRQELTGWALERPDGFIMPSSVRVTKAEVIDLLVSRSSEDRRSIWREHKKNGYSVRRVRVTVEVEEGS